MGEKTRLILFCLTALVVTLILSAITHDKTPLLTLETLGVLLLLTATVGAIWLLWNILGWITGGAHYSSARGFYFPDPPQPRPPWSREKRRAVAGVVASWFLLAAIGAISWASQEVDAIERRKALNPPLSIPGHPIANLGCTKDYILVTELISGPRAHDEVSAALTGEPGARYLRVDDSCDRAFTRVPGVAEGYDVYAIYLGPFSTRAEVRKTCSDRTIGSRSFRLGPALGNGSHCVP